MSANDPKIDRALAQMPAPPPMSDALRAATRGAAAVTPLASPERRALLTAVVALGAVAAGGALIGMAPRTDAPWRELGLLVLASLSGIWLTMRSAIPGRVPPAQLWAPV